MQLLQKKKKKIMESILCIFGVVLLCLFLPICFQVRAEEANAEEHGIGVYFVQEGTPENVDVVVEDADHPAPKTGDTTPAWIIISCTAVMLLSALVIVLVVFFRKRRN